MFTTLRDPTHMIPIHTRGWMENGEIQYVVRGPFEDPEKERQKYVRLYELLETSGFIPAIDGDHLRFDYFKAPQFNIVIHNDHMLYFFKNLIVRFIIGSGSSVFSNFLFVNNEIIQLGLDSFRFNHGDSLLTALFSELNMNAAVRESLVFYISSHIDDLSLYLESLKHKLSGQELKNFFSLKSVFCVKEQTRFNFERERKKKIKKIVEVDRTNEYKTKMRFPKSVNFLSMKAEKVDHSEYIYNFTISDFYHAASQADIKIVKREVFLFLFDYCSISDIVSLIPLLMEAFEKRDFVEIFNLIGQADKNSELFIKTIHAKIKPGFWWNDLKDETYSYLYEILCLEPFYFQILSLENPEIKTYSKINTRIVGSGIRKVSSIRETLFSSLCCSEPSKCMDLDFLSGEEHVPKSHLMFEINDQKISQYLYNMYKLKLDPTPAIISKILNR